MWAAFRTQRICLHKIELRRSDMRDGGGNRPTDW